MTCEKLSFDTWDEAQHVVNIAGSRGRGKLRRLNTKIPKRAYRCEFCSKYHLTSMKKEKKKGFKY